MTATEWAWMVGTGFWGLLVAALCLVLLNLFRLVSHLGRLVRGITEQTVPLIGGVHETVSGINVELARVDAIVAGVQRLTETAHSLAGVIHVTIATPLVKTSAYLAGVGAAIRAVKAMKE